MTTPRLLFGALFIAIAAAPGCSGCGKPPPIPLDLPDQPPGTLLFPPAEDGWLERAPFDTTVGRSSRNEIGVYEPKLDPNGRFEVSGSTFTIRFDKEALDDVASKSAPLVTITPSHPGRTVWTSKDAVEFRADKPFDPDVEYTATLPELTGPTGNKLTGGFKGIFKATPETTIAGKTVHWIPKPGEPRVVYVRPVDDRDIGPNAKLVVIWDQPIDDARVAKFVTLQIDGGAPVPLTTTRPPAGSTFEGEKVDTRSIALFSIANMPAPGTKMTFSARGQDDKVEPTTRALAVRPRPALEAITCGGGSYGSSDECEAKGSVVKGSVASSVTFKYTNRIANEDIDKHVSVTPAPAKLRVSGWGEEVWVDAAWTPATTYQVRVSNVVDRFGYRVPDASATFTTLPRTASAILREGVMVMDPAGARDFYVTTRNVKKGELLVWPVAAGHDALVGALADARNNKAPSGTPRAIAFDALTAPHVYERVGLDLSDKLEPGHIYLAQVKVTQTAYGAAESTGSSQPSVPLIMMTGKETPGAHVHVAGQKALVHVYRFASGDAVAGASVTFGSTRSTTDDKGVAVLDLPVRTAASEAHDAVTIRAGNEEAVVPLDRGGESASEIYPELTTNEVEGDVDGKRELLGVLITDRGIYRPGSRLFVKGHVRKADDKRIAAVAQAKVVLRVKDALDTDIVSETLTTSAAGTITKEIELPKPGNTGRHRIRLEIDDAQHTLLAEEVVRVAEFETPRFKVDVDAPADMPEGRWKSKVVGRYFFGAPMDGANVEWILRKKRRDVDGGKLDAAGFTFGHEQNPFDSEGSPPVERPRTGSGKLGRDGSLDVDVELGPLPSGPTDVTFEADVSDESYRHVAGRKTVLRHPFARYGGLKLGSRFGALGALKVELAAVDTKGKPASNAPMEARLERLEWKKSAEKAESGAIIEKWTTTATAEGTCAVTVEGAPRGCDLTVKRPGDYRVVARIDGRDDASVGFYAWAGASDWNGEMPAVPSSGKKTPISTDKKKYAPGDVAKVLVQSPFAEATAILTVERGGILSHETRRIKGPSAVFEVPLSLSHAPYAHAVATLLPIGGPDVSYRVGVVRLPVALDGARLGVKVTSDKKTYDAKETAEITVEVKRGDQPVKNADVTLAVVDEAVLRMTDFHAKDPTAQLHPPRALSFTAADSRALLFRRKEKAHVAGGGGADENDSVDSRKDFVETAAWLPSLTTDGNGRVTARVKLPDNLTEFRMMATVVADDGSAGTAEDGLIVTRPFLLEPIIPAFALKGDRLEIAAMVHNNTAAAVNAKVKIDGDTREVRVPANGRQRVGVPFTAEKWRETTLTLEVDGKARDRVTKAIRVGLPGTEEHPQLSGVFRGKQEITLAIPADAIFDDGAKLVIKTGAALYPELGQRLLYLQAYPHGCVEQTTSGLLPLLAAQNLIPWTGVVGLEEHERRKRIEAGVKHLATMKVPGGGLSMWPGGGQVNVYGTLYAARALLLAKKIGIEEEGLLSNVLDHLGERLRHEQKPGLKVAIAESLAMAEKLEPDVADSLMDTKEQLDVYGLASLALALSTIPGQGGRVTGLLDQLEASFDEAGMPKGEHGERDWYYWGSVDRDRAQTLLALVKLRPASKLAPKLAHRLIRSVDGYTTQTTAWSLVALAAFVGPERPNGSVDVKVKAEGVFFDRLHSLGGDNKEVGVALADLRGKKVLLRLEADEKSPCSFAMEARYVRPDATSTKHARRAALGPSMYRVYTDAKGRPIDLAHVKAGDVVRVALRMEIPKLDDWRATNLAVTDRLAAGFQPIQPDLATVAEAPSLEKGHPFYDGLNGWGGSASYVDVRDDRVKLYFDRVYGGRAAYATYLVRAVTPGDFLIPSAVGELMYEPGSFGYSDSAHAVIE